VPPPTVTTSRRRVRVGRLYAIVAVALTIVVAAAPWLWPTGDAPRRPRMVGDWLLGNWLWWDGGWYVHIAQHGYSYHPHQQSSVAFFPGYPMTVRALGAILPGGIHVAAVAVTVLCGLATFKLFGRWCERHMDTVAASWSVMVLAVYPYGWFLYGAAYADALFLAATLLAFLLLDEDRPIAAGCAGMIATATRPTGVVVIIGLVAVMLERRGVFGRVYRHVRLRDLGVGLAAVGIIGWCVWLALRFGHPLAFIEAEGAKGWDRAPGLSTWLKLNFFNSISHGDASRWAAHLIQAVLCLAFLAAVPAVWRRFGSGYGIYVTVAVLVPAISTDDFMGTGRYLLAAFPVLAIVGSTLAKARRARWLYTGTSAVGLAFGTSLFATGHYLT
jgi:Gpi18-like mannosyltransferase